MNSHNLLCFRAMESYHYGNPHMGDDTVYFSVVDKDGNACSFINSIYMNFGSGLVPQGCGFALQVRCYKSILTLERSEPLF